MPQLTITNNSELYPEALNSLNKNASNEMSEYLRDKIRKHAMKQARRNHSVFPDAVVRIFCPVIYYLFLGACGIQKSDVKIKGTAANCRSCICSNSQVSKYQSVSITLQDFYCTAEAHD